MTTKTKLFLAKLLIFFSLVLIFIGVYLQFNENKILHPIDDVTIISGEEEEISVTPVDKDDIASISGSGEGEVGTQVSPSPTPSTVPASPSPTPSPIPSPSPSASPSVVPSTPSVAPTVEEKNEQLRTSIENNYGITVKFGTETYGYNVGGMSTTIISDVNTCNTALNALNNALALYPTGFFKEIANNGYPLTIYLIKRYSTANVTGVTDSTSDNIIISIATDYSFDDTFHHETYHYIEKYIYSKGFQFTSWGTLNPASFAYGTVDTTLVYTRTYSADSYFVNTYAQSSEYEDRASTFEYMMMSNKASCLTSGKPVWLKAKTMSEQIDYFLSTVSPNVTEYWERHIY